MRSAILEIASALVLGALALAACQHSDVSRSVGARCDGSSECEQRCLVPGTQYPGGFCTIACATRTDCPGGTTCAEREGGVCLFECATNDDCTFLGLNWRCVPVGLHGGGVQVMACSG